MPQTSETPAEFFLIVTPGFEALAEQELREHIGDEAIERSHGGLQATLPLSVGLELNRVLKIPTRILVRLMSFGCRDFPKLYKKMAGFQWVDWLSFDQPVEISASTHKSRLFIKKRIEQSCAEGYLKYWDAQLAPTEAELKAAEAKPEPAAQEILVRFDDDICTVSLDTSGEMLYKRGEKVLSAEAPLRETIAAALLRWMSQDVVSSRTVTLVDPMVGSGTFAIEAAKMHEPAQSRRFAFEDFRNYRTSETLSAESKAIARFRFTKYIGLDIDAKSADTTQANWENVIGVRTKSGEARAKTEVYVRDAFKAEPLTIAGERWLITNPPYGERLKIEGRLKDYYESLFEALEASVRPDRACFVLPDTAKPMQLKAPARWKKPQALRFQNGGLPVTALLFIAE